VKTIYDDSVLSGKAFRRKKVRFSAIFRGLPCALVLLFLIDGAGADDTQLWHHRNLGKAFYENPTTHQQAVEEFKKALDLAPDSPREVVNYGLSLLRAGRTAEGIAELERAQRIDPSIPHTWFNLGIEYKRQSEYDRAIVQFEKMASLVPDESITRYNLGVLYKIGGRAEEALREFETAALLDPNLSGPHFQLYNAYREANRAEDTARELERFQEIKKRQAGAVIPEDLEWSYYSEIYETLAPPDDRIAGMLRFEETRLPGVIDPGSVGLSTIDFDGDGKSDLLVWSQAGVRVFRNGVQPVETSGLEDIRGAHAITPGDYDNDGLADLCVLTESGAALYRNEQGKARKTDIALPAGRFSQALWVDFDHDYDIDLFLFGMHSKLMRNNGTAGFSDESARFPFIPGEAVDAVDFELISDTNGFDLAVLYRDRGAVIYRDRLAGVYEVMPLVGIPPDSRRVVAHDYTHDSWIDLAVSGPSGVTSIVNREGVLEKGEVIVATEGTVVFADLENRLVADLIAGGAISRNQGTGRFAVGNPTGVGRAVEVAPADFDEDGKIDLAYAANDGSLHIAYNRTPTQNRYLRIGLTGIRNLKLAPGAEVEVKAGPGYHKTIYRGVPLHFGVGGSSVIDAVRITWPNGLIQNQPNQTADRSEVYKEAQRLSGSCPMIFTWNGKEFEFITDALGVAPLGASAGDGQYFPVDHDEYIYIPGSALSPRGGQYEIRITEELREVTYLDRLQLIAVDHPASVDIFTNDKFKAPPFPEFRLFGVTRRQYPVAVRNHQGDDVRASVLRRDRVYADGFERTYSGVAERHTLDLDFGTAAPQNRAVLILSGWVDWADGSTFLGAMQEQPGGLVFPFLQVKDKEGVWQTVIEDMGIPAGKPKTIAVDLTGKFLSDSREVRIVTSLCVYWDEIFLSEDTGAPNVRMTLVEATTADLRFRGFSLPVIDPERKQPEHFDYQTRLPLSMWNPTPGRYTRYGNVQPLVAELDDRMAVMGSGDEIQAFFPADALPPLAEGWTRDFLLYVDGWAKDADANTAFSQTVEPLPHHGMSRYPYPPEENYPGDGEHNLYREYYNTRPGLRLIRPLHGHTSERRNP